MFGDDANGSPARRKGLGKIRPNSSQVSTSRYQWFDSSIRYGRLVHPREVFRPAIKDSSSAILLVHNHPSGDPTPSREDQTVTEHLTKVGTMVGITVLDHIVVAREGCVSIREYG
ncbi:MAG: hypothetical protein KDB00_24630 [Planctomycetales bacterium]|nr:hypothetical protein [Planctomycetales bacterium]